MNNENKTETVIIDESMIIDKTDAQETVKTVDEIPMSKADKKKALIVGIIIIVLIVGVFLFINYRKKHESQPTV